MTGRVTRLTMPGMPTHEHAPPRLLDALSWAAETVEEVVVHTVRDVHHAVVDRTRPPVPAARTGVPGVAARMHDAIAATAYGSAGLGFRGVSLGLALAAAAGAGPRLETGRGGRLFHSAVNGLSGDRLAVERPRLAITMAVRFHGADVPLETGAIAASFPAATDRIAVLLHGLGENDASWNLRAAELGASYADTLAALGWTPVRLRYNTGLTLRENGAALSTLLQRLVTAWPVAPAGLALVGHSMGGLVARAACAVRREDAGPWTDLLREVITLGTPHTGAPAARWADRGSRALARHRETAPFARILDRRSEGIADLEAGLGDEVPPLPGVRYRLVSATVRDEHHPVSRLVGDLLVLAGSARAHRVALPEPEVLHLSDTHHLELLNHPEVHEALRRWLR